MFIRVSKSGHTHDGQQFCHGLFLMVVQHPTEKGLRPELRAIVRHVKMSQLGHFMMASVKLGKYDLCLSGSYGSDGLPMDLRRYYVGDNKWADFTEAEALALFDQLVQIPSDLQTAFWEGGGHNSAGKEGPSLRAWALASLKQLRKIIKK